MAVGQCLKPLIVLIFLIIILSYQTSKKKKLHCNISAEYLYVSEIVNQPPKFQVEGTRQRVQTQSLNNAAKLPILLYKSNQIILFTLFIHIKYNNTGFFKEN